MHDLQSKRHKSTSFFPITVGHYSCQSIHRARGLEAEMFSEYEQEFFPARLNFDPFGVARKTISQEYAHVPSLEDFWMKCKTEYEVRKKDFSRLSARQVFDFGLARIPADLKDDGPVLLDTYHQMGGDRVVLQENVGGCHTIEERSAAVLVNTSNWLLTKGYCLDEALMNQVTGNFGTGDSLKRKHGGESSRRPEKMKVHRRSQSKEKITSTAMMLVPASPASSTSPTVAPQQDTAIPQLNPATFIFSPQPLRSAPVPEETLKLQMAEFERALSLDDSEDGSHNTVAVSDGEESEREIVVHSATSHSPRKARVEINSEEHDLQLLLSLGGKDRKPKVAKETSRLIIEESGQKFAEMSVPAKGRKEDEFTAEDITVTTVPIGQATTKRLKQDTQTLIDALFLRLDKEKAEKVELQKQVSQLCEIIAKVAKSSTQPISAQKQVSDHLMQEMEDASNQVKAIDEWKSLIIRQASVQLGEVPAQPKGYERCSRSAEATGDKHSRYEHSC
ncbi:hypothetical protein KI387_044251 [Taxus chinensis]|uniref:Uncharacterized protein n=2 Tax=Taxus chinensis TaxID=29808 RepID=A0AA38CC96_TAXCH|nr:hypothetical protein KI387_044251 [Taxus chinensis]